MEGRRLTYLAEQIEREDLPTHQQNSRDSLSRSKAMFMGCMRVALTGLKRHVSEDTDPRDTRSGGKRKSIGVQSWLAKHPNDQLAIEAHHSRKGVVCGRESGLPV